MTGLRSPFSSWTPLSALLAAIVLPACAPLPPGATHETGRWDLTV
jgi:hypothetical protein